MLYIDSVLCFSLDSKFCQKKLRMILYYFCTCKILVLSGASAALAQAGSMLGITRNCQAIAQIALATILSLVLYASLPDHPSLECLSDIWTELVDKSCITKK